MKFNNIKLIAVAIMVSALSFSCSNDDDGGSDDDGGMMGPDFSGTFMQEDHMGRPGINTVLSGTSQIKNTQNVTIPSNMAQFQDEFENQVSALHGAFGVEYETNILNLSAAQLTGLLASDVLQVATDAPTTYFDGTNVLTGRNLKDDVIDISLILLFGGNDGMRFAGQDTDGDGEADLPILVTDNVDSSGETPSSSFPYLEEPHN